MISDHISYPPDIKQGLNYLLRSIWYKPYLHSRISQPCLYFRTERSIKHGGFTLDNTPIWAYDNTDMNSQECAGDVTRRYQARQQLHHGRGPPSRLSHTTRTCTSTIRNCSTPAPDKRPSTKKNVQKSFESREEAQSSSSCFVTAPPGKRGSALDGPWRKAQPTLGDVRPSPCILGGRILCECAEMMFSQL